MATQLSLHWLYYWNQFTGCCLEPKTQIMTPHWHMPFYQILGSQAVGSEGQGPTPWINCTHPWFLYIAATTYQSLHSCAWYHCWLLLHPTFQYTSTVPVAPWSHADSGVLWILCCHTSQMMAVTLLDYRLLEVNSDNTMNKNKELSIVALIFFDNINKGFGAQKFKVNPGLFHKELSYTYFYLLAPWHTGLPSKVLDSSVLR